MSARALVLALALAASGCATTSADPRDPLEGVNRAVFAFNDKADEIVVRPAARLYRSVTPQGLRDAVRNFFNNIDDLFIGANNLLQGKAETAVNDWLRFAFNSTLGFFGVIDWASDMGLEKHNEDFGQTLGTWGWKRSRYVEVPLFGPRTVRDLFGMAGDAPVALLRGVEEDKVRVFLQGLQLVDVRTQLFAVDSMREGAADDYALVRDAWLQRRRYQIFGDRKLQDEELPEYLREDTGNPSVPADAMPIMPAGGN